MTVPITYALAQNGLIDTSELPSWVPSAMLILDILGAITFLAVAIIGLNSAIGLSPAASYGLIGISAFIGVSYICYQIHRYFSSHNLTGRDEVEESLSDTAKKIV